MAWADQIIQGLKDADVSIIAYVPDGITWRILSKMEQDPFFHMVPSSREEEAIGIISGAYAAGKRGAVFMQSSGFGNCINALATLNIPSRIPFPMFIGMRGGPGEFNMAQVPGARAIPGILDSLGLQYFSLTREDELDAIIKGGIALCYAGRLPVANLLSTLLTGGRDAPA
jgi:sulfopyruvate decarboxylase alpha subunit